MKVSSGEYEIMASGTVLSFGKEPVRFDLDDETAVRFIFEVDPTHNEPKMKYSLQSINLLDVVLTNFNNPIGMGTSEPVPLGNISGRQLYLNFRVHSTTDTSPSKLISYTWYLGSYITQ